jgi:hypothetical protein
MKRKSFGALKGIKAAPVTIAGVQALSVSFWHWGPYCSYLHACSISFYENDTYITLQYKYLNVLQVN